MTANDLAAEVGKSPKTVRAWLRETFPRDDEEKGLEWEVTLAMREQAQARWLPRQPITTDAA